MAPRKKNLPTEDDPEVSQIYLDGYLRLAAAIVSQAFFDVRRNVELEKALHAFTWLVFGDGLFYLDALDFDQGEIEIEEKVILAIGRLANGRQDTIRRRQKYSKHGTRSDKRNELTAIGPLS